MDDPIIIRCQCKRDCKTWIRMEDKDTGLLGDRHLALVHPTHAQPADLLWDVRRGYLILHRTATPATVHA